VGCGKSSLLSAINTQMIFIDDKYQELTPELVQQIAREDLKDPPIKISGTTSFVEQKTWIENKTI
jgi:hypothetical protein